MAPSMFFEEKMKPKKLQAAVDAAIEERIDDGFRTHLGASIIGRECTRSIWYDWRWAKRADHSARVQRIFDRGTREEESFAQLLRDAGISIITHNKAGEQYKVSVLNGHFEGSLDGVCSDIPDKPEVWAVTEFKTYNDSNFKALKKEGVEKAFYTHYVQGTVYAVEKNLDWVLYCAVNKDTDELYFELYRAKKAVHKKHVKRAEYIIFTEDPPPRMATTKTFFKCKMCRYHGICWEKEIPTINCRTCGWSEPTKDGQWQCVNPSSVTEGLNVKEGCPQHMFSVGMLAKFTPELVTTKELELLNKKGDPVTFCEGHALLHIEGKKIKHSPEHITSEKLFKRFNK